MSDADTVFKTDMMWLGIPVLKTLKFYLICIILQTKFNPCAQKFREICKNIKIANTMYFVLQASPFLLKSLFLSKIYTGSIATGNFREPDYNWYFIK